nr:MAG TPA: hypothetical protein [Caudoviricetes sp.]
MDTSRRTVRRRGTADGVLHVPGDHPVRKSEEKRGTKR